jgi:DNA polymerase III epsilon subunit family exonuclease
MKQSKQKGSKRSKNSPQNNKSKQNIPIEGKGCFLVVIGVIAFAYALSTYPKVFFTIVIIMGVIFGLIFYPKYAKKKKAEKENQNEKERRIREYQEFVDERINLFKSEVDALPFFEIIPSGEKHDRNKVIYIETKNLTKATNYAKICDFVAVSVETTGLKVSGNDIIRLSAVKYNRFKAVQVFDTYVKPRKSIPADATAVNGITDEMVENAPYFYQIINSFNEFIGNMPLVAHNAGVFHMKHLYVNGLDSIAKKTIYCTLELSKYLMKDEYSYSLEHLCKSANIYMVDTNSIYKSFATGELFKKLFAYRNNISMEDLNSMFVG